MQFAKTSQDFIQKFYTAAILPQFSLKSAQNIEWEKGVPQSLSNPNGDVRYFKYEDGAYALLYEDYPTVSEEELIDSITTPGRETLTQIPLIGSSDETVLRFAPSHTPYKYIPHITGYFQLFKIMSI